MLRYAHMLAIAALAAVGVSAMAADETKTVHDFKAKSIKGKEVDLSEYKGKVLLITNVASKCGLTPQYEQLESLYEKFDDKGLVVLAFPCNQFGGQEPGTDAEVAEFCKATYDVKFPLFSKIDVNKAGAHDLYKYLTSLDTAPVKKGEISWNFEKFIVGKDGKVVARFGPRTSPEDPEVMKVLEAELAKK